MKHTHRTRDGRVIPITDMDDNHLANTIRLMRSRIKEGVVVATGGGSCAEDIWYDETTLTGDDAAKYLNLQAYITEATKRGLKRPSGK